MALYRFLAASRQEGSREMLIEADSRDEALDKLRARSLRPVRFLGESTVSGKRRFTLRRSRIDTFSFTRQLAPLLGAAIPLDRALGIIAEGAAEAEQREFVNSLRQGLHEGRKFSELVRSHGALFPDYYANLIESGEETGCLPDVLRHLQQFMAESKELKDFIVSSSIYPAAILSVTVLVSILLFTVFVPKFAKIFLDMGRDMPPSMNFLLGLSSFAAWAWWLIPLLAVGGRQALIRYLGREQYAEHAAALRLKLPVFGPLIAQIEMCRYLRTLAILIANHVEILRTVRIAGRLLRNPVIAAAFKPLSGRIKGGEKLSAALAENAFLPRETVPMLRVGEESGTVGEMLTRIADNLEVDTRRRIKRLLSLFEPAVIIVLAVLVLIVVASIFMAMMDINAINQGGPGL